MSLSVNAALIKAKALAKKGAPGQAGQLYQAVLKQFPGNKRAIEGLKALERRKHVQAPMAYNTGPVQEQINGLIALYERGRYQEVLEQGTALARQHPNVPLILNILGAVNAVTGRLDEAETCLTKALRLNPDYAEAHNSLGNVLSELGKHDQAVASYAKALRLMPDYADAHNNLGNALNGLGKHEQAIASYSRALQLRPDYADAYYNLANSLGELGKYDQAVDSYTKALQLMPDLAEAHNNLANALSELGRHNEAVDSCTKALRIKPDYASAHNNLANSLIDLGKHEQAVASYTMALQIKPDYAEAHCNLATALSDLGKVEQAIESYTKALRIKPDYAKIYENLGRIRKYKTGDPLIDQMHRLIADRAIDENDKTLLSFALGKAYDDIGDVESAFRHFLEGNRLRKKELGYDISSDERLFSQIKSIFSESTLPTITEIRPASEAKKQPIFIVGMHRSGTTLVEQILSSHSQVYGADEVLAMDRIVRPILSGNNYTNSNGLTEDTIRRIRADYLSELDSLGTGELCITDKMPLNFRWIGFILAAMPEAKIINIQRDPVATCWSVFKQYFSNRTVGYAYDLADIAEYYRLYISIMGFWKNIFPGHVYDLNYESLTNNQGEETRKLLEYCGLDWEKQCLEFHKTRRAVRTPSSAQVRRAMYKGSSGSWRKYEMHLQPLLQALEG